MWYGPTLDYDENGFVGEYNRYNNPHKIALYIRAHKPVIIWEQAADADFIREKGVGITVDSLENIDKRLAMVSEDEYNQMLSNIDSVASEMAEGYYIKSAINRALQLI